METKIPLCTLRAVVSQLTGQSRPELGKGQSLNSPDISTSDHASNLDTVVSRAENSFLRRRSDHHTF